MDPIKLELTGPEALDMIRTQFPNNWQEMITEAKQEIQCFMRLFNLEALPAYQRTLAICCTTDRMIVSLAALHLMNKTWLIGTAINKLKEEQEQCINQSLALESSAMLESDKQHLRSFYPIKQVEIQKKIDELTKSFEVIGLQSSSESQVFDKAS